VARPRGGAARWAQVYVRATPARRRLLVGGRNRAKRMDAVGIESSASQPLPRRTRSRVRRIGELRLPIAGPYRPRARLYLFPDGRLAWLVRLWEYDRPVPHLVSTATVRAFARRNRLSTLEPEIERLVELALAEARRAP
jgi:hypothetical protein